ATAGGRRHIAGNLAVSQVQPSIIEANGVDVETATAAGRIADHGRAGDGQSLVDADVDGAALPIAVRRRLVALESAGGNGAVVNILVGDVEGATLRRLVAGEGRAVDGETARVAVKCAAQFFSTGRRINGQGAVVQVQRAIPYIDPTAALIRRVT